MDTYNMLTGKSWQRIEISGCGLYLDPQKPDWLVANDQADKYLLNIIDPAGGINGKRDLTECLDPVALLEISNLQGQINHTDNATYQGRANYLELDKLKECWFHLTDNCNLACKHCLFAASPSASATLPIDQLEAAIRQAKDLGCRLFYFTGGEPFVYPKFTQIISDLLADTQVHVVVLTNGLLVEKYLAEIKELPADRLHLQISMDGLEKNHDKLRGTGSHKKLMDNLALLRAINLPITISVAINRANIDDLSKLVNFVADHGVKNIHLLWHFVRGKGSQAQFVPAKEILPKLIAAQEIAAQKNIFIDNVETIKSQVFSTPGTRYDLSNTAWESIAVGPDAIIYPSPALVGMQELACGNLADGLENVWRTSQVLNKIRQASSNDSTVSDYDPFRFITGGGDIDHSYMASGKFVGHDPYMEVYNGLALWLIQQQARQYKDRGNPAILLRMGDVRYDCPDGGQAVSLTHCNCVISLSDDLGHSSVREFYGQAALAANEDIVNPFAPEQAKADFIPQESRQKSYGCGSPVADAMVKKGEVIVDLGSGSGVECFMAADAVGPQGKVYGIDMTDEMLNLAHSSKSAVVAKLGYDNVEFLKGFLEDIPLPDASADAIISNCVINLSPDKRQTFQEVFRILKPGGRMVVSDIVTDEPIPVEIKNNEQFRGECLGGAMQQEQLLAMLRAVGFTGARLVKRFPYRKEDNTDFYSLTFCCYKPKVAAEIEVIYRGPFAAVYTEDGILLRRGQRRSIPISAIDSLDESVFIIDDAGAVANIAMTNSCCSTAPVAQHLQPLSSITPTVTKTSCCPSPTNTISPTSKDQSCCQPPAEETTKIVNIIPMIASPDKKAPSPIRHTSGCMVCGGELTYLHKETKTTCHFCGKSAKTSALCANNHFICDDCHQEDGLFALKLICTETRETDMITLLKKIRSHPAMPMHGPEHHAMVPGIILATYRNRGGEIKRETILAGIERGSKVPGGVCGFWGTCGAATGVGIAFSTILGATPLTPDARQQAQLATSRVLHKIAQVKGGRCCQRETVTALLEAVNISKDLLTVELMAEETMKCDQYARNKECIRKQCPLWQSNEGKNTTSL